MKLISNTVFHDNGSAIKLENNGANINLYNNIIQINGGFGIEVIGGTTGYDSNYNDIFLGRPGANTGRWLGATSVTLANWKTASGKDAASIRRIRFSGYRRRGQSFWLGAAGCDQRVCRFRHR